MSENICVGVCDSVFCPCKVIEEVAIEKAYRWYPEIPKRNITFFHLPSAEEKQEPKENTLKFLFPDSESEEETDSSKEESEDVSSSRSQKSTSESADQQSGEDNTPQ